MLSNDTISLAPFEAIWQAFATYMTSGFCRVFALNRESTELASYRKGANQRRAEKMDTDLQNIVTSADIAEVQ